MQVLSEGFKEYLPLSQITQVLQNLSLTIALHYQSGQISQSLNDQALNGSVNLAFALGDSQTKNFPSPCSGSVCTVQPHTIALSGTKVLLRTSR